MSDESKKKPRGVLTLRLGESGVESLDRIAAHFTVTRGKKVTRSEVHRDAIKEYALRHDPALQRRSR